MKNKRYIFVRFGGLDVKAQKGFSQTPETYHQPPTTRGFYAMPKIAQEFFLIGCLDKTQKGIFAKEGSDKYLSNNYQKNILRNIRKEFYKDKGYVWHHLGEYVKHNEIVQKHGSWVKTDIRTWEKAFSKMCTILKYGRHSYDVQNGNTSVYVTSGTTGPYSKDHCEVFFDEKV